jgi:NADH:ubiquinone oxidoreductase subunit 2 (subunit N)
MSYSLSSWPIVLLSRAVFLGCLTPSLLVTWIILELRLLLFLMILKKSTTKIHEELIYYFVVQALGRRMILLSWVLEGIFRYADYLILIALILKMGLFPFQSWYMNIVHLLDYQRFWVLRVPLKLVVIKLCYLSIQAALILWIGTINIVLSFISVLKEKRVLSFLALGSIFNTGWSLLGIHSNWLWLVFILVYGANLKLLLVAFYNAGTSNLFFDLSSLNYAGQHQLLMLGVILIGIPPFAGFILKLVIFFHIMRVRLFISTLVIALSLAMTFYYLLMFFYTLRRYTGLALSVSNTWVRKNNYALNFNFLASLFLLFWLIYYLNNKFIWLKFRFSQPEEFF